MESGTLKISCSHWGMFDIDPFTMLLWTLPITRHPGFIQRLGQPGFIQWWGV